MCSIAAAKLHTLIQTRPIEKLNETCFVMATIHDILRESLLGNISSFVIVCFKLSNDYW